MLANQLSIDELRGATGTQPGAQPPISSTSRLANAPEKEQTEEELRDALIAAAVKQFNASLDYQNKVKMPTKFQNSGR